MKKVIDSMWFSQFGNTKIIGIVIVEYEDTGVRKAFIGEADGIDESLDELHIIETGAKFIESSITSLLIGLRLVNFSKS